MTTNPTVTILPAEFAGIAQVVDGTLNIGGVQIGGLGCDEILVYIRRRSDTLAPIEILAATHDGYAQEELDAQNDEADRYPLGPKEYWRSEAVGKWQCGGRGDHEPHVMDDFCFERDWDPT